MVSQLFPDHFLNWLERNAPQVYRRLVSLFRIESADRWGILDDQSLNDFGGDIETIDYSQLQQVRISQNSTQSYLADLLVLNGLGHHSSWKVNGHQ